jgi:hypothetical protein
MTMTLIKKAMAAVLAVVLVAMASPAAAQTGRVRAVVEAFETVETTVWLPAGSHRIVVDGDGDTDLDLFVYHRGMLVAVDDDGTDYCIGRFYLPQGGYVRIQIRNLGSIWNRYILRVE